MKSSKFVGVWRPVLGVVVVGAMALGVSALAGPRGDDQSVRGTVKSDTEVARLVTGDPAQINAVVAGTGNTAIIAVVPIPPANGIPYPDGVTINGNELTIDRDDNKAAFRAWFHAQVSKWDPLNNGVIQGTCTANGTGVCTALTCTAGRIGPCVVNTDCDGCPPPALPGSLCCIRGKIGSTCGSANNASCTAAGTPFGCCTGPAAGTCTDDDSCDVYNLSTVQVTINCTGYYKSSCFDAKRDNTCNGGPRDTLACVLDSECAPGGVCGLDLKPAVQACGGAAACRADNATGFGESWGSCVGGFCANGYVDGSDAGANVMSPEDKNYCTDMNCAGGAAGVATTTCNYKYFEVVDPTFGGRTDGGLLYYVGTLVLDLPAGAKGKYVVNLNNDETFVASTGAPPVVLDPLRKTGFVINYVTGSCCHNLGTPTAGCFDSCINRSDCEIPSNAPYVFTPQKPGTCVGGGRDGKGCSLPADCPGGACTGPKFNPTCAAAPTAAGCVQCVSVDDGLPGGLCDDSDACTDDRCEVLAGICLHPLKSGFVLVPKGGTCCNKSTGVLTDKDDDDVCTRDSCSAADNRGAAVHDFALALGDPCDDLNACAVNDKCNGLASEANGGCVGTPVNGQTCTTNLECQNGGQSPTATCDATGHCFCTVTPKVTYELFDIVNAPKTCVNRFNGESCNVYCAKDSDCPPNCICDVFYNGANCYYENQKFPAFVHIGVAAEPVNGGQFLIKYDPSCVDYDRIACLPPYTTTVYGPIVNEAAGTIFIACGVDPFAGLDGPLGNVFILGAYFTMIGECNNCFLDFGGDGAPGGGPGPDNPMNTYLVDAGGYKIPVETQPKEISEFGTLVLNVPDNISVNSDCDVPSAVVTWDSPSAKFNCGDVNLECRGAHYSGLSYNGLTCEGGTRDSLPCGIPVNCPNGGRCVNKVYNGGKLPQGASTFCCYAAAKDKCDQVAGCKGDTNNCRSTGIKPNGNEGREGCWTVDISDQISMDIHIQLEPPMKFDEQSRCIEFCLYGNCFNPPVCFEENVLFGGINNYIGKANGKIKAPKGKWGCITAQDQLHSLRSCDTPDCIDGQLVARFKGDPTYGGNWLIMGNLDGWKKAIPTEDPSLDVIDILDFGKFVASFGVHYADRKYGCHEGPHADINGDGVVDMADYSFIIRNFLVSAKDCCCGPSAADLPPALTEVSIDELRQMGEADMVVADLNGDGVVNADDMEAFMQGARPVKSNDRRGGKGLRSGR